MGIFLIKCPQYNRSHDSCWISFASLSFSTNISLLENVCLIIFTNKAIVDSRLRLLRRRKIEPRPYAACTKNLVKIASVVPEISSRRDRQRDTQPYSSQYLRNPYRGLQGDECILCYHASDNHRDCKPFYFVQNLTALALVVPKIWLRATKLKMCHVTLITFLIRVICHQ